MAERMVTTYSMWNLFRNCRKKAYWRYMEHLAPLETDWNLSFGRLIHDCLEIWHNTRDLDAVGDHIDRACANRAQDTDLQRTWHLAIAMMRGYTARYAKEEFSVVELEKVFEGEIVNPDTGANSRSFTLSGRVDGIVEIEGEYFLIEHKTASVIDAGYLERLWTDFQITIYAHYIEKALGIRISGVIYNILVKARLRQGEGETEIEFEQRRAKLLAKSKTGKTSAKRRMPESDETFQTRLADKYEDTAMFHREILYLSRDQYTLLASELWELTQAFLDARRRNVWYQNTSFCFQYGRPCSYYPLCRSRGNPNVKENLYQIRAPNEELRTPALSA